MYLNNIMAKPSDALAKLAKRKGKRYLLIVICLIYGILFFTLKIYHQSAWNYYGQNNSVTT